MLRIRTLIICFTLVLFACEHEVMKPIEEPSTSIVPPAETACDTNKVYFEDDILPLMVSNCAFSGCHDAGSAQNGIVLTSYANIINSGGVEPNDTSDSEIYERITETDPSKRMPRGRGALTTEQIEKIAIWIMEGAPNTKCQVVVCDTTNTSYQMDVLPILNLKCVGCHRAGNLGGGIALDNYLAIRAEALNNRLVNVITHQAGFKAMPLGGNRLPECEIKKISAWVNAGAPNN